MFFSMASRWTLVAITYNVNKQRCQTERLIAFLNSEPDVAKAHIVCVGLQVRACHQEDGFT